MKKSKVYLVIQTVVCCAIAVLLTVSSISIYHEGAARRALDPMAGIYTPQAVKERLVQIAPLVFVALGLLVAGLVLGVKDGSAEKPVGAAAFTPVRSVETEKKGVIWAVAVVMAAVLILAGVFNGSARDVLYKAITICTECVGLG